MHFLNIFNLYEGIHKATTVINVRFANVLRTKLITFLR